MLGFVAGNVLQRCSDGKGNVHMDCLVWSLGIYTVHATQTFNPTSPVVFSKQFASGWRKHPPSPSLKSTILMHFANSVVQLGSDLS